MAQHKFLKKFLKGGAWALFVRVFTVLTNLALNMLIARLLSPEDVGTYFLLSSFISVMVTFAMLGLDIAIVRIIARSVASGRVGLIASAVFRSRVTVLISTFVLALIFYMVGLKSLSIYVFENPIIYDLRVFVVLWLIFWGFANINAEILRGYKQFHIAALFKRLAPNFIVLVITMFVFINHIEIGISTYLKIVIVGWFSSALLSSLVLKKYFLDRKKEEDISYKELLSTAFPLWFTAWITFSLPELDLWILAMYMPPEAVALYGSAARLVKIVAIPLLIVQGVVPPLIAEAFEKKETTDLGRGLQTVSALAFIPAALMCVVYVLIGDSILALIYGDYYSEAYSVLKILTIGVIVKIFAGSSQSLLTMSGHGKTSMLISIFAGLILVIGCIYFGSSKGLVGIALSASFAIVIHSVLNLFFAWHHTGIWTVPLVRLSQIKKIVGFK